MAGTNGSDARAAVAVIGAGIMGSAMARNLVTAGLTHGCGTGHQLRPVRSPTPVRWSWRRRARRCGTRAW